MRSSYGRLEPDSVHLVSGWLLAGLIGGTAPQTPPIFHPGAPGEASRVISAAEAVELSRTGFVEADVRFMQHMIVHHAQAVEMVDLLADPDSAEDPLLSEFLSSVVADQSAEILRMQTILSGL